MLTWKEDVGIDFTASVAAVVYCFHKLWCRSVRNLRMEILKTYVSFVGKILPISSNIIPKSWICISWSVQKVVMWPWIIKELSELVFYFYFEGKLWHMKLSLYKVINEKPFALNGSHMPVPHQLVFMSCVSQHIDQNNPMYNTHFLGTSF